MLTRRDEPRARSARGAARPAAAARPDRGRRRSSIRVHRRRPAVDDQLDTAAQVREHVLRGCRRHVSRAVRRRRHQRAADRGQDVARDRMAGNAHGDRIEARGGKFRHRAIRTPGQHQGEGPGQNAAASRSASGSRRQSARAAAASVTCAMSGLKEVGPCLIESRDRLGVGGVGAEPIDGLGGEGDEAARGEHARGQRGGRATLGRTVLAACAFILGLPVARSSRIPCLRRRGRRL